MLQPSAPKGATVVALAVVAALATWSLVRALGIAPIATKASISSPVTAVDVAVTAAGAGLVAWGVFTWLSSCGAVRWWPFVGSTALTVSMIAPSWFSDGVSAAALICLHLVVGFVLIQGLAQAASSRPFFECRHRGHT